MGKLPLLNAIFSGDVEGPAISHFLQLDAPFWCIVVGAIAACEWRRASFGWEPPNVKQFALRESYQPGELNFDPLDLLPSNADDIRVMQDKELRAQDGNLRVSRG